LLQHGAFTHCVACGPTGGELLHAQNHLINFVEQVIDEVELGDGPIAVRSKLDNVKITIFLNPHDLVGKIFDEISDMFGTGIIMTRGGRLLELHKSETVFAFGICNEDRIVLAHRGSGGGKRARAGAGEARSRGGILSAKMPKEEKLEALADDCDMLVAQLGRYATFLPFLEALGQRVQQFTALLDAADVMALKGCLSRMSIEHLRRCQEGFESNAEDVKTRPFVEGIFAPEFQAMRRVEKAMTLSRDLLTKLVEIAIVKGFSESNGAVQWAVLKKTVNSSIESASENIGRRKEQEEQDERQRARYGVSE
jgi:hypothetical protein